VDPVTCPSCGSQYNPETHELVHDTKLKTRIAELEAEKKILYDTSTTLQADLQAAQTSLGTANAILNPPKAKRRDFIVGSR
jgi:hypothetical protein